MRSKTCVITASGRRVCGRPVAKASGATEFALRGVSASPKMGVPPSWAGRGIPKRPIVEVCAVGGTPARDALAIANRIADAAKAESAGERWVIRVFETNTACPVVVLDPDTSGIAERRRGLAVLTSAAHSIFGEGMR